MTRQFCFRTSRQKKKLGKDEVDGIKAFGRIVYSILMKKSGGIREEQSSIKVCYRNISMDVY